MHSGARRLHLRGGTGLIESLEGKRAYPRIKRRSRDARSFGCPNHRQQRETLACVPHIVLRGDDGSARSAREEPRAEALLHLGSRRAAGRLRAADGQPLANIYTHAGGIRTGAVKGVIPAARRCRSSRPPRSTCRGHGSVEAGSFRLRRHHGDGRQRLHGVDAPVLERSFYHESCGQCTPADGHGWMEKVLVGPSTATPRRPTSISAQHRRQHDGNTICALADARPCRRVLGDQYRAEFEEHAASGVVRCAGRGGAESACPRLRSTAGRSRSRTGRRSSRRPTVWASRSRTTAAPG